MPAVQEAVEEVDCGVRGGGTPVLCGLPETGQVLMEFLAGQASAAA